LVDVDDAGGVSPDLEPLDVVRWQVLLILLDEQTTQADLDALKGIAIERAVEEAEGGGPWQCVCAWRDMDPPEIAPLAMARVENPHP